MASNEFGKCTGECFGCEVANLGVKGSDAVNEVVKNHDETYDGGPNHDEFDEAVAGLAVDATESHGLSIEQAPAVAAAAQRVLLNECPEAVQFVGA